MFDAGALIFRIQAQGAQVFQRDMAEADKAADRLGKSTQKAADGTSAFGSAADKSQRGAQSFRKELAGLSDEGQRAARDVGGALTGIGAALVATSGLAAKAAMDWESAWAGVTKTVDGTPEQLDAVQEGLRGMTGELPAAHEEIAAVAEAAGQLGVQTDSVVSFTKTMIDLGETTNLSADEAATALARFINIMGTSQSDVDRLGSAVVGLGNNYATTEAEIVAMSMRLAGAGKQVGLTEGDVLGLATALSSVGIEAEAGGSAVSKVMIDIAASVEEGGDRLDQFASIAGVSAAEFSAQWRKAPAEALSLFVKGLGNAEAQGQSTLGILADLEITEVRMRDALLRAASAGDLFTEAMAQGNAEFEANNALTAEANKRYETTASQLQIMRNSVKDAAIDIGGVFLPMLADMAGAVSTVTGFIAGMPEPVQQMIGVLGLGAGAVALFGGVMLLAVPKIIEFNAARATLTAQLPRTTGALKGMASFLTGPWAAGIAAGILALQGFKGIIDDVGASSADMQSSLKVAESAASAWKTLADGKQPLTVRDMNEDLKNFGERLDQSAGLWDTWYGRAHLAMDSGSSEVYQFNALVGELGEEISLVASTDMVEAQRQFKLFADESDGSRKQLWALLSLMPDYKDQVTTTATEQGVLTEGMSEAERQAALLETAMGSASDANKEGGEVAKTSAEKYLEESEAVQSVTDQLNALIEKLDEANDANNTAITTSSDYEAALDAVRDQVEQIAAGEEGYARGLDLATEAGRDNMALLQDQAGSAREAAEAQFALDSNVDDYIQRLRDGRDAFIQNAQDLGATQEEAEALADQILRMPSEKQIKVLAETAEAEEALRQLEEERIARIKAMVTVTWSDDGTRGQMEGGREVFANSGGNVIESYANGGHREQHVAQMARAGAYRVWAEPETGGESYIPHALEKRARSEQLMAETAAILGGTYIPSGASHHAAGSVSAGTPAAARLPRLEVVNRTGVNILDYIDIRVEGSRQSDDDYLGGQG